MRYFSALLVLFVFASSCKNESGQSEKDNNTSIEDGLVTMRGEFIYYDEAAVLQTPNAIYGVIVDDMTTALQEQILPFKESDMDMVTVTVRAKRIPKPEGQEGWPYSIEIKEILKIEKPEPGAQDVIELSK